MITAIKIDDGGERMHLCRRPFRWPWLCASAIRSALPDAAWQGIHRKPLDAAIGRLPAPNLPGGRQGDNQLKNDYATCTHFDFVGHFDDHHDAAVLYCAHPLMEGVCGFHKSHLTPPSDEHLLWHYPIGYTNSSCFVFRTFHREKDLQLTCLPLISIGVWHIKLTRSTWLFFQNTLLGWLN